MLEDSHPPSTRGPWRPLSIFSKDVNQSGAAPSCAGRIPEFALAAVFERMIIAIASGGPDRLAKKARLNGLNDDVIQERVAKTKVHGVASLC